MEMETEKGGGKTLLPFIYRENQTETWQLRISQTLECI
jgi:hypothetical protein